MSFTLNDNRKDRNLLAQALRELSNVIVIGHLNKLWLKRFEMRNMTVIDSAYDMDKLSKDIETKQACYVLVISSPQDVSFDVQTLFKYVVRYEAPELPSCMEFCKEQYAYIYDPEVTQDAQVNAEDELACGWCTDHDLFSCIYDMDLSCTSFEIDIDHTDCHNRCIITHESNKNEEHKSRGQCPQGETWYEKYGFTFSKVQQEEQVYNLSDPTTGETKEVTLTSQKEVQAPTFKGKQIK